MLASLLSKILLVAIALPLVTAGYPDCKIGWISAPKDVGVTLAKSCAIDSKGSTNENNQCNFEEAKKVLGITGTTNYYYTARQGQKQLAMLFSNSASYDARIEIKFNDNVAPLGLTIPKNSNGCYAQDWDRDISRIIRHGP